MPCVGQPRDAPRDHPGLAAAGPGQHQQRAAGVCHRGTLCLVESRKQPFRHRKDGSPGLPRRAGGLRRSAIYSPPPWPDVTENALAADWFGLCRRAADRMSADVRRASRRPPTGSPAPSVAPGGDRTLVIDSLAENAVFDELEALHAEGCDFTVISEERGTVVFGDGPSDVRVVVDPIDGSLNAKRLLPTYSLSIAVAAGEHHGGRRVRLRARLRHRRGVHRAARAGRRAERRAAGPRGGRLEARGRRLRVRPAGVGRARSRRSSRARSTACA